MRGLISPFPEFPFHWNWMTRWLFFLLSPHTNMLFIAVLSMFCNNLHSILYVFHKMYSIPQSIEIKKTKSESHSKKRKTFHIPWKQKHCKTGDEKNTHTLCLIWKRIARALVRLQYSVQCIHMDTLQCVIVWVCCTINRSIIKTGWEHWNKAICRKQAICDLTSLSAGERQFAHWNSI